MNKDESSEIIEKMVVVSKTFIDSIHKYMSETTNALKIIMKRQDAHEDRIDRILKEMLLGIAVMAKDIEGLKK